MLDQQLKIMTSPYMALYDNLVKKDNLLRQINEQIDFTFIYEELRKNYSEDQGRPAQDLVMMFKYLMLKSIFKLLGIAPEDQKYERILIVFNHRYRNFYS